MTIEFTPDFWNTYAESLTFERVDAKNPDQSRPQWTNTGTAEGIVSLDDRTGYLQSERGLDTQGFIYKVVIETGTFSTSLQNKDRITTTDGTHLHIIFMRDLKGSIYTELTCSNIEDPNIQRRR